VRTTPPSTPKVRRSTRSISDLSVESVFAFSDAQLVQSEPARILSDSLAHDLPYYADFRNTVGLTAPTRNQPCNSTVGVNRQAILLILCRALLARLPKHSATAGLHANNVTLSPALNFPRRIFDLQLERSLGRLNYLRSLPDGWMGEDSCGASKDVGDQAEQLLRRIRREVPSAPLPVLGLDNDGTIVMSWSRSDLVGSMTIYGDGTYSYFVRRNAASAKNIEAMMDQPLAKDLTELLAV